MVDFSSTFASSLFGTVEYGDLVLGSNGDLILTSDAAKSPNGTNPVLQSILQRLRTFQGEYFLDNTAGVPYFQLLLGHNGANSTTDAVIQNTILATPGVQMLTAYRSSFNSASRVLSVSFACNTTAGQITYNGAVTPNADANQ